MVGDNYEKCHYPREVFQLGLPYQYPTDIDAGNKNKYGNDIKWNKMSIFIGAFSVSISVRYIFYSAILPSQFISISYFFPFSLLHAD